ncbi:MAG TPA: tRNA (adenosine(37)-N6)-threonylcarbamoyltransferase complex ATPase subunit type 1 TsaE [Cytophagaceae bacterium]|jgi:tRNA threonylcarbamoyladenosine biosynthesis protein TsaE|nr:tRNA (adenosine(37)-N6)-threonylcarbamoyltransferase complex ATPase subunit type 1 TsaE [Cytophagaceae bacterium]
MKNELTVELELISSLDHLSKAAEQVVSFSENTNVWLFEGPMGAGKTTLIKAICKVFGVKDNVSSPTFSLVNEYHNIRGNIFYHFDFYRIKSEEEASDIGVDEYFYSEDYCFVEWPSMIPSLLPDEYIYIHIEIISETERKISVSRKTEIQ